MTSLVAIIISLMEDANIKIVYETRALAQVDIAILNIELLENSIA
jgi:hypothetical protein